MCVFFIEQGYLMKNLLVLFRDGIKKNYKAGLVLQLLALGIVLTYYFIPSFQTVLNRIGALKAHYGFRYSAVATMIFGGGIPFLILLASGQIPKGRSWKDLLFFVCFWSWKGVEVDAFYRLQALIFGKDPGFLVVAAKVFVDQFIYGPIWAAPTMMLFYLWKDTGYSFSGMKEAFSEESFLMRVLSVLIPNLIVWIPAVSIIYSLPVDLQLPLFNIVLCFWALILNFVASPGKKGVQK